MFSTTFSASYDNSTLQRVWLNWASFFQTHQTVEAFMAIGMTEDHVKSMWCVLIFIIVVLILLTLL